MQILIRAVLVPLVLLGVTVAGAILLVSSPKTVEATTPDIIPPTVRVQAIEPGPVDLIVESQGTVSPSTVTELIPEVSGRVEWMAPSLVAGGSFKQGDVLLRVDSRDYQSTLQRAEAAQTRARAEAELARFEYERLAKLEQRRLASRSQLEAALRTLRVAQAAHQEAVASIDQARRDLQRTQLRAPFDGLVRSEQVDLGQFVSRGAPVASVYAAGFVEVRLPIADQQLAWIDVPVGLQGRIPREAAPRVTLSTTFAGREYEWTAYLDRVEAEIDRRTRMVNVVARVENNDPNSILGVGMFVDARIHGRTVNDVVSLPRQALQENNRVLVVDPENRLRFRPVEPLRLFRDQVILSSGLSRGERVCLSPVQTPVDGMLVAPQTPDQV